MNIPQVTPRPRWPQLRHSRWLFLVLGIASLGYSAYALADANLYQAYENWRFDRTVKNGRTPSAAAHRQPLPSASLDAEILHTSAVAGSTIGRLEIARLGIAVIILEGTDELSLRRAVGHVAGTSFPGEAGNIAIAGHRDTFFRPLRNVRQDDKITLTTVNATYTYRVDSLKVVEPGDTAVLNDSGGSTLTLVTCYPFYYVGSAPKRFIVRAHRDYLGDSMASK